MYRPAAYWTVVNIGLMTVGCAKNTGSVVSNDPFASGGDPFQAVANHSKESDSTYAAKTATHSQPAGWSRTQPMSQTNYPAQQNAPGVVNTGSSLRFQTSAPMPEITAEKPVTHRPMPAPPMQTVEAPPSSGIQQAQFFTGESQSSGVTPASFESSMPVIRPRTSSSAEQSPVSLDMPVFAEDTEETPSFAPTTSTPGSEDEWWNN